MTQWTRKLSSRTLLVATAILAGACGEDSAEPISPIGRKALQPAVAMTLGVNGVDGEATDPTTNTTYQYSDATRRLKVIGTTSTYQIEIPEHLRATVLTMLEDLSDGMNTAQAIANADLSPPPSTCGQPDGYCDMRESISLGEPMAQDGIPLPQIRIRHAAAIPPAGTWYSPVLPAAPLPDAVSMLPGTSMSLDDGPPNCTAIGQAISNARFQFMMTAGQARPVFDALKNASPLTIEGGVPTVTVPGAGMALGEAVVNVSEKWHEKMVQGSFIKLWNTNYCFGRTITVGPLNPPTNRGGVGGGGSFLVYTCRNEWWQISYDGGQTWEDFFSEEVCSWGPQQS